jgi:hypothetical protein
METASGTQRVCGGGLCADLLARWSAMHWSVRWRPAGCRCCRQRSPDVRPWRARRTLRRGDRGSRLSRTGSRALRRPRLPAGSGPERRSRGSGAISLRCCYQRWIARSRPDLVARAKTDPVTTRPICLTSRSRHLRTRRDRCQVPTALCDRAVQRSIRPAIEVESGMQHPE